MVCTKCKREIPENRDFCPYCGSEHWKRNFLLIVIIGILVTVAFNTFINKSNYTLGVTLSDFRQRFNNTASELAYKQYIIDNEFKIQSSKDGNYIGYGYSDGCKIIGNVDDKNKSLVKLMISVPVNKNTPSMYDALVIYDCAISAIDPNIPNKGTDLMRQFGFLDKNTKFDWSKKNSIEKNGIVYTFGADSSTGNINLVIENVKNIKK